MTNRDGGIDVLHVDDDEDFLALSATFLERVGEDLRVEGEPDPRRARERLVGDEPATFDCVVSDLDMPGVDGLALLETVRERHGDLPFVLFTGKGSEEIASEAISAGVTDYLQKAGGSEQFEILANRIENAVSGHRARLEHERAERRFRKLIEESVDVVAVFGPDGTFRYLSPAAEAVVGYEPDDLVGEEVFEHLHPDDRDRVWERFATLFSGEADRVSVRCQFRAGDGSWVDLDVRGRNLLDDPDIGGVLVYGQDATGRVQRERELERYETMANESGDMIYTTDRVGNLTAVNDAAVSFLGYPREELVGERVAKIVTEESIERGQQAAETLREDDDREGVTVEQEYVTADGETVPTEMHLTLLSDSEGSYHGAVGVVRDITTRKERERTFRALHGATHDLVAAETREEAVDLLVRTARDVIGLPLVGLWFYDEEEHALLPAVYPDDPMLPEEPPIYREGSGLSWEAFVTGESRAYSDLRAEDDAYNPETAIGSELVVPIGDHGVLNSGSTETGAFDETDRYLVDILAKTTAAALDRLERESALEQLHAATRDLMEAEDRREIAELTGETARGILDHQYAVIHLAEEDGEHGELLRPVATTDRGDDDLGDRPTYRFGEGTAGAAYALGEIVVYDARDLDDDVDRGDKSTLLCAPLGAHGVLTIADDRPDAFDDTDVQLAKILAANAETALVRVAREARLARQNERLEEFASVASHDLRNPLNVAMNHVELLRASVTELSDRGPADGHGGSGDVRAAGGVGAAEDVEEVADRLVRVGDALDRMNALVDDVLSLARGGREVIDPEPVQLTRVAMAAWSTVGGAPESLEVEGDPGVVVCDVSRLRQVLENLFRNAHEHVGESVAVRVGRTDEGFYVEDDGPGIPPEERADVFDSGYTTADGGTGFGLAIVSRIAEAHGWSVELSAGRDGGAKFVFDGVEFAPDTA